MSIVYSLVPQTQLDGNPLVASLLVLVGFLLGLRLCHGVRRLRHVSERVLILGGNPLGGQVIEEIERQPHLGYAVVGVVENSEDLGRVIEATRSEEHTSELQSPCNLVCRLLLEKKKKNNIQHDPLST